MANHMQDLPDKVHAVAVVPVADASRDALTAAWTKVVQDAGEAPSLLVPMQVGRVLCHSHPSLAAWGV